MLYLCKIFPNPSKSNTSLQLGFYPQYIDKQLEVSVVDANGKKLITNIGKVEIGIFEIELLSSQLTEATYQITIRMEGKLIKTMRLIKL